MSWAVRGVVCVAALTLSGCVGLDDPESRTPSPDDGSFVVRYEKVKGAELRGIVDDLRTGGVVDEVVDDLNDYVVLPFDVPVSVRSCDDGAQYDPEEREIQLCLEDVAQTRELLEGTDDAEQTERGILVDTVIHEAGHALLDVYDMQFTGREEDVADQFSAFVSVRQGDQGLDDLEAAAYGYEVSASEYEEDPTDEHASDAQRAVNYQCYVYGSEKRPSEHLVAEDGLTKDRAEFCWEEWADLRDGWVELLKRADAFRDVRVPADQQ